MASWQSKVLNPILRLQVKRRLAKAQSAETVRKVFGTIMPSPRGASFRRDALGGVVGEWVEGAPGAAATMLFLHGGGYMACSPRTHRPFTASFALRGMKVFAPDYRLAPEHAFPAALDDALAVYREFSSENFVLGGDSAGGGLALATLLAAKSEGLPMPAGAILFSPWTDLAGTGASVLANQKRDSMLYGPRMKDAAELYLQGADPKNPLASPLYGDLNGLPPLLIQVGEPEILLDDSTRLAERAGAAGVSAEITIWKNLPHVWQVSQVFLPEARTALDQAAAFARARLAKTLAPA